MSDSNSVPPPPKPTIRVAKKAPFPEQAGNAQELADEKSSLALQKAILAIAGSLRGISQDILNRQEKPDELHCTNTGDAAGACGTI